LPSTGIGAVNTVSLGMGERTAGKSQHGAQTGQLKNLEAELQSEEYVSGESQDAGSLLSDARAETSQRSEGV